MHVLLMLARVPVPEECERSSVDSAWLLSLAAQHDLVVAVDENTAGCDILRDADIDVLVSDKRHVYLPGDERIDADTALANSLATRHTHHPFDLVVVSSERPSFGPVRDVLRGVPWAVLAASGPTALARRLGMDDVWLARYAEELWHAASNTAAADVVVSPVAPDVLGIDVGGQQVTTLLPVPEPQVTRRVTGEMVAVIATGVAHAGATETVEDALAVIDVHPSTSVLVIYTPPIVGARDLAPALAAGVPAELEQQVVLVPNERHGRAGEWLAGADALVLADASELLVPAVARRAALIPTAVLGTAPVGPSRTKNLLTAPPVVANPTPVELLQWTRATRVTEDLRVLRRSSEAEMIVVHDEEATTEATRWLDLKPLTRFDVVVGATERPPWSMANPKRLHGGLVALHRRTWNAVAEELERVNNLSELITRLADPGGARSHTMAAITVQNEPTTVTAPGNEHRPLDLVGGPLPHLRPPMPVPTTSAPTATTSETSGQAPPATSTPPPELSPEVSPEDVSPEDVSPEVSLRAWARETHWSGRARLALPWRLGLAGAIRDGEFPEGVAQWAKHQTITDRARLLLPWKWGLLPRAMEDHW